MKNRKTKKLSRRKFTGGLAAAGLSTPMLLKARKADANPEDGAAELVGALIGLLYLSAGGRNIAIKRLIFLFAASAIVLSVSSRQKFTPVSKLPKSSQPGSLRSITQTIATAYVLNSVIYIVMATQLPGFRNMTLNAYPTGPEGEQVAVQKNFRTKSKKVKNLPSQSQVKSRGQRIGVLRANAKNRNLYLEVKGLRAKF